MDTTYLWVSALPSHRKDYYNGGLWMYINENALSIQACPQGEVFLFATSSMIYF